MWRKARNSAKKYDNTLRAQQKAKDGSKLNEDQQEKVRNLEEYKRSVMDSIDTLTLFTKHYKEPQDLGEEDENEGVEEMKN